MKKIPINWKYTIGEILIVSVGILIAFSINTCSSQLKEEKDFKDYTASLTADLNQNLINLNDIINAQEQKITNLKNIIEAIGEANFNSDSIGKILFEERKSPTFYPINGTFKSLVSHGDIELFNTQMKRELFNLYDTWYPKTVYNGNLYDNDHIELYEAEIREMIDYKTKKIDNLAKLQSKYFIKNLMFIIDEADSYLKLAYKSKFESEKMLNLITSG